MSSLLGGNSKQTSSSTSGNQAFGQLSNAFGGVTGETANAGSMISQLLGASPMTGDTSNAFNGFRNSTGYQDQLQQGSQAITGNAASKGLLQSGATAKGLQSFGQNLASQSTNDYISNLFNLGNQGLQAGQLIAGAGQSSNSSGKSSSKTGLGL
jgi:hypothetical protein